MYGGACSPNTGAGRYSIGLVMVLSLIVLSMGIDMFGFAVVVAGASCDLQLTVSQKSILASMPFAGVILMSYPWGYFSDTQGRKKTLMIGMSVGFVVAVLASLSPNWIVLAILKLIGTSFSSCAQSGSFTLLGESTPSGRRGNYMLVMSSFLMTGLAIYNTLGYFILRMDFSEDISMFGHIMPWRLLMFTLALPMGLGAMCLTAFHESPKFLANDGRHEEALSVLKKMWVTNGKDLHDFKMKTITLDSVTRNKDVPLLTSLWEQTAPLFQQPLLLRTLQLFFLLFTIYSTNNSLIMWFPFIVDRVFGAEDTGLDIDGLCNFFNHQNLNSTASTVQPVEQCNSVLDENTVISGVVHSLVFTLINAVMCTMASKKKMLTIGIMAASGLGGIGCIFAPKPVVAVILLIVFCAGSLCIGIVSSYFVELYPTSFRGMVSCLGVMVSRLSALIGVNLTGALITTHCKTTMYIWCGVVICGVVVACFLPSDSKRPKKIEE